jgi:hypothetical protein
MPPGFAEQVGLGVRCARKANNGLTIVAAERAVHPSLPILVTSQLKLFHRISDLHTGAIAILDLRIRGAREL